MMRVNVFRCCHTPPAVLRPLKIFSPRVFWSSPPESPICLRMPAVVTLQAQLRFRRFSSTIAESSSSADAMSTDLQRAHPTEIKGQSGCQYQIERVLQDKGSLLGRVFLATYIIPNMANVVYPLKLIQRRQWKVCVERDSSK